MPKRVVGILIGSVLAALSGAAGAADQIHNGSKPSTTPTTQQPAPLQTNTAGAKYAPVSHDVCEKHPNLKQCS